jgi:hypothetical protein
MCAKAKKVGDYFIDLDSQHAKNEHIYGITWP